MNRLSSVGRGLSAFLMVTIMFTALALPVGATGTDNGGNQANTVNLVISGGDANALALCLNVAKEKGKGDVNQKNKCKNTAFAQGGNVFLKNVDITVLQENASTGGATPTQANTVNLTIEGGDANALAACINAAIEKGKGDVNQKNKCKNRAYAIGGTVVLKNVSILVVQANTAAA